MFYSQFVLAKKGPLGTIWIAAHLERKLRKNQVAETDIGVTVDSILFPEVSIALRLSGHLLLGVVRIYSRQVNYLFNDCSETLGKIKQAFHSAAVDLPPEATTAPFHTITLPETFDFDELELHPDSDASFLHLNGNFVDQHVTTREQITLQDTVDHNPYLGSSQFGLDERFGDDGSYFNFALDFDEEFLANKGHSSAEDASTSAPLLKEDTTVPPMGNESATITLPKEDVVVPSTGYENEATPMDIDDHPQPVKSRFHEVSPLGESDKAVSELGNSERDNCSNAPAPSLPVVLSNEHANSQVSLRKDPDFANSMCNMPPLHAYTPRPLEACTPDLNREYRPPDEPSTPALVNETSLPVYNELTVDNGGRFSPVVLGNSERMTTSETLPGPLQPQRVNPISSSSEALGIPSIAPFQGFALHQAPLVEEITGASSTQLETLQISSVKENVIAASAAFPSFTQQACLQQQSRTGASSTKHETVQISSVKENVTAASAAFPSFTQQECLQQQSRTGLLQESANFSTSQQETLQQSRAGLSQQGGHLSGSVLTSSTASLSQLENVQISSVKETTAVVSSAFPSIPQQAYLQQSGIGSLQGSANFSTPQQGTLKWNRTGLENAQISSVKENTAAVSSAAFASIPQQACLQQSGIGLSQEGANFSAPQQGYLQQNRTGLENVQSSSVKDNTAAISPACIPQQACLQQSGIGLLQEGANFSTPQQGSLQQNRTGLEDVQISSVKENTAEISSVFPSIPEQACLQQSGIGLLQEDANFSTPQQGSLQQNRTGLENVQISSVKENVAAISSAFPSIPQQACLQQSGIVLLQESANFSTPQQGSLQQNRTGLENVQISSVKENTAAVSVAAFPSIPPQASLQQSGIGLLQESAKFSTPLQGSLQQNRTGLENVQISSVKEDAAAISTAFPSFPRQACLQQSRTDLVQESANFSTLEQASLQQSGAVLSQEGPGFPTSPSGNLLTSSAASLPQLDNVEVSLVKENTAAVSTAFPSVPQQASLQQSRTGLLQGSANISTPLQADLQHSMAAVSQEGANFPIKTSHSMLTYPAASFPQIENVQISSVKENAAEAFTAFPSFPACLQQSTTDLLQESANFSTPQQAFLQQSSTVLSQEGAKVPTNPPGSLLTSSTASMHQLENVQMPSSKENAAAASPAFPTFSQQACLQQSRTGLLQESASFSTPQQAVLQQSRTLLSQEGANYPTNIVGSLSTSSTTSLPQLENVQTPSVKESAPAASTALPSFPKQAYLQQDRTGLLRESANFSPPQQVALQQSRILLSHEAANFPRNTLGSLSTSTTSCLPQLENNVQTSSVKESAAAASTTLPSFPQQAYLQQTSAGLLQESANFSPPQQAVLQQSRMLLSHEGANLPTNTLGSLSASSTTSFTRLENVQTSSVKENAASTSTALPGFPQQAYLQQKRTGLLQESASFSAPQQAVLQQRRTLLPQEGANFPTNTSGSLLTSFPTSMSQPKSAHVSSVKENASAVSSALPSFSQQACLQQGRTGLLQESAKFSTPQQAFLEQNRTVLSQEGGNFPTNLSRPLFTSSATSMPQADVNSSSFINNQWSKNVNQVVSRPFPQPGLADGTFGPKAPFQIGTESSGFGLHSHFPNSMAGQGLMATVSSPAGINPSFLPSSASSLSIGNVRPSGQMEHMDVDQNLAASKGLLWQSTGPQFNASSSASVAPLMLPMGREERETLRSAHQLQSRSPNFFLPQKDMSDERLTGLEAGRNKFNSPSIEGATKKFLLPGSDTPVWRNETPSTAARASALSTPSLNSVPGDNDVLASILGRRNKGFKVISTPIVQKPPKANVATKRPKLVSRATPKRRKVELDTVAVLHGDVIRQQLANTEDIRRERRKAPCTRREVWGFLRECEGQENFDEPTLPELSADVHELYHDVIHGRESRAPPLSAATYVNELNKLESAEESDLLAHYVKKISTKDAHSNQTVNRNENFSIGSQAVDSIENHISVNCAQQFISNEDECPNQVSGNAENVSQEKCMEQLKEDPREETAAQQTLSVGLMGAGDAETAAQQTFSVGWMGVGDAETTAQQTLSVGLMGAGDAANVRSDELAKPELGMEVLAEKEGQPISFPMACTSEGTSGVAASETRTEEQGAQAPQLGIEERSVQTPQLGIEVQGVEAPQLGVEERGVEAPQLGIEVQGVEAPQLGVEVQGVEAPQLGIEVQGVQAPPLGIEVLAGREGQLISFPVAHFSEGASSMAASETRTEEQGVQATQLKREHEVSVQMQVISMANSFSEGVLDKEFIHQDVAMVVQQEGERISFVEQNQPNAGFHEQRFHEGQLLLPSEDASASLQSLDMPSAGKDSIETPIFQAANVDNGMILINGTIEEGEDKVPTSVMTGEETNVCRIDEEMVAMETEKDADMDADCVDDDNDVAYAEIDYSSDEQELSVRDDSGWSTRSRNVGKYLKVVFQDMESSSKRLDQGAKLGLERLLARRTKREAARMFFETLVLKTKDYIHVEQDIAYQDILIYPKSKLMKTEF